MLHISKFEMVHQKACKYIRSHFNRNENRGPIKKSTESNSADEDSKTLRSSQWALQRTRTSLATMMVQIRTRTSSTTKTLPNNHSWDSKKSAASIFRSSWDSMLPELPFHAIWVGNEENQTEGEEEGEEEEKNESVKDFKKDNLPLPPYTQSHSISQRIICRDTSALTKVDEAAKPFYSFHTW